MFLRTRWQSSHLGSHLCLAQQWLKINASVFFGVIWAGDAPAAKRARPHLTEWLTAEEGGASHHKGRSQQTHLLLFVFSFNMLSFVWRVLFRQNKSDPQPIFCHILFLYQNKHCALVGNDVIKNSSVRLWKNSNLFHKNINLQRGTLSQFPFSRPERHHSVIPPYSQFSRVSSLSNN